MADVEHTLKMVEPRGEMDLGKGVAEVVEMWPVEGGKDDVLVWVKSNHVDVWELGVYYWPEILMLVFGVLGFVYVLGWLRKRWKLMDVKVGEVYCKGCGYVVNGDEEDAKCAECGKRLKGGVLVRGKWKVSRKSMALGVLVLWGMCGGLFLGQEIAKRKAVNGGQTNMFYGGWKYNSWWSGVGVRDWVDMPVGWMYEFMVDLPDKWRGVIQYECSEVGYELWGLKFVEGEEGDGGAIERRVLAKSGELGGFSKEIDGREWHVIQAPNGGAWPQWYPRGDGGLVGWGGKLYWYEKSNGKLDEFEMGESGFAPTLNRSSRVYDIGDDLVLMRCSVYEDPDYFDVKDKTRGYNLFDFVAIADVKEKKVVYEELMLTVRNGEKMKESKSEQMTILRGDEVLIKDYELVIHHGGEYMYRWPSGREQMASSFGDHQEAYAWTHVVDGERVALKKERMYRLGRDAKKDMKINGNKGDVFDFGGGRKVRLLGDGEAADYKDVDGRETWPWYVVVEVSDEDEGRRGVKLKLDDKWAGLGNERGRKLEVEKEKGRVWLSGHGSWTVVYNSRTNKTVGYMPMEEGRISVFDLGEEEEGDNDESNR
ncbi:hypothetical protein JD969_11250 [Planctomycetota bacterium]|nr:hypothetical protein JD969_11250 [Planctomycetota bacterium]